MNSIRQCEKFMLGTKRYRDRILGRGLEFLVDIEAEGAVQWAEKEKLDDGIDGVSGDVKPWELGEVPDQG